MAEVKKTVNISEILTWNDYLINNDADLLQLKPNDIPKDIGHFPVDAEINNKISIYYEFDITCLKVDGIVSSNSADLVQTGGVSQAVVTAGGLELMKEIKTLNGCKCGEAKTTLGYSLPSKYVVHTVGPRNSDPKLLRSCYENCLKQMELKKMKSLAFCCVATGYYGFSNDTAVHVALKTVRKWLEDRKTNQNLHNIDRIIFCLFGDFDEYLYKSWMQIYFPSDNPNGLDALRPLPGFIKLTTTKPDMITLDNNPNIRRAIMPCGHVIGSDSMTDYAVDLVSHGKYVFVCPDPECGVDWQYFLVRHVARLSQDEMQKIEKKISDNYLKKASGMQNCPGCQTWCYRLAGVGNCVRCAICTAAYNDGRYFDFCWSCLRDWKGSDATVPCGNQDCDGKDRRLGILLNCPAKKIHNCPNCPSIRGCPKCGMLIEHKKDCGHMKCTNCNHGFCFICMQPEISDNKWTCAWNGICTLAPRQTNLPGTN